MKVEWTRAATDDVRAEAEFIARDRPMAARRWVERIQASVSRLEAFPFSGQRLREAEDERIREIIVDGYRVVYRTHGRRVMIVHVRHSRRPFVPGIVSTADSELP